MCHRSSCRFFLIERTIDSEDLGLFHIMDSPREAVTLIRNIEYQDIEDEPV
jgi:hypothetical protein